MQNDLQARREYLWTTGQNILLNSPQDRVSVDIETNGRLGRGSIVDWGAVSTYGESLSVLLKPVPEFGFTEANRAFCEEHGYTEDYLMREGVHWYEGVHRIAEWTAYLRQRHGKPLVLTAFNNQFDGGFTESYFARLDMENPFGFDSFDIKSLADKLSPNFDWVQTQKINLPREIVPARPMTHTALEDARDQQLIYFGLVALLQGY